MKLDTCQQLLRSRAREIFEKWEHGEMHGADVKLALEPYFDADLEHSKGIMAYNELHGVKK